MSRLDQKVAEENRKAFITHAEQNAHVENIASWLEANPRIGLLNAKEDKFYYFDALNQMHSIKLFETI